MDRVLVAELSLIGMGLDLLGGCYLAYDLLGGKQGPLRVLARAAGYVAIFFVGYLTVIGLRYALIAASGMGVLLAIEFQLVAIRGPERSRSRSVLFGLLRGVVLGLASWSIADARFAVVFGSLSGIGLSVSYLASYAPTDDYAPGSRPRVSKHQLLASFLRALAVSLAAVVAGLVGSSGGPNLLFGVRLGLAAGTVSALVGLFSPPIEFWIESLPARRLGLIGLSLIMVGVVLQSVQYWAVVFEAR